MQELNPALKADEALKPLGSDISAADAMRFAGAIPEGGIKSLLLHLQAACLCGLAEIKF